MQNAQRRLGVKQRQQNIKYDNMGEEGRREHQDEVSYLS